MLTWLGCIVGGILTMVYAITSCPAHPSASRSRMEAVANIGFLVFILGVFMISWRFITAMSMLPK